MESNMKYFKNKTGDVFAYTKSQLETVANIDNPEYEFPIPQAFYDMRDKLKDMTELTGDELEERLNPTLTIEQLADTARAERDAKIEAVRWRIERHSDELALGIEPTEPLEPLLQYVQALRDVPQQEGFPTDIIWPETPMDATR